MSAIPKYVLLSSQVFGLFPIKYVKKIKSVPSIEFSRLLFLNHLIIVSVLTTMSCLALYMDFTGYLQGQPIFMHNSANVVSVFLIVVSLNSMAIVVFVSTAKNHRNIVEMCHILEKIDKTLQTKFKNPPELKCKVLFIYLYATGLMLATEVYLITSINLKALIYAFPMLVYYIQTAMYIQFTFLVKTFTKRFHIINKKIEEEVESQTFNRIMAKDLGILNSSFIPERFLSAGDLQLLIDSYIQLFEAVQEASAFYSSQLFIVVTSSFVHNTLSLYALLQQTVSAVQAGEEVRYLWNPVLWISTHIAHLVLLVRPCTTLTETAAETPPMVCRLLSRDLNSSDIRKQLRLFLLKLLHFEVRFSAMGFFGIHSHILTSIASSAATYLVVMIQFKSDDS